MIRRRRAPVPPSNARLVYGDGPELLVDEVPPRTSIEIRGRA